MQPSQVIQPEEAKKKSCQRSSKHHPRRRAAREAASITQEEELPEKQQASPKKKSCPRSSKHQADAFREKKASPKPFRVLWSFDPADPTRKQWCDTRTNVTSPGCVVKEKERDRGLNRALSGSVPHKNAINNILHPAIS